MKRSKILSVAAVVSLFFVYSTVVHSKREKVASPPAVAAPPFQVPSYFIAHVYPSSSPGRPIIDIVKLSVKVILKPALEGLQVLLERSAPSDFAAGQTYLVQPLPEAGSYSWAQVIIKKDAPNVRPGLLLSSTEHSLTFYFVVLNTQKKVTSVFEVTSSVPITDPLKREPIKTAILSKFFSATAPKEYREGRHSFYIVYDFESKGSTNTIYAVNELSILPQRTPPLVCPEPPVIVRTVLVPVPTEMPRRSVTDGGSSSPDAGVSVTDGGVRPSADAACDPQRITIPPDMAPRDAGVQKSSSDH